MSDEQYHYPIVVSKEPEQPDSPCCPALSRKTKFNVIATIVFFFLSLSAGIIFDKFGDKDRHHEKIFDSAAIAFISFLICISILLVGNGVYSYFYSSFFLRNFLYVIPSTRTVTRFFCNKNSYHIC